ncbi:hypothetical protein ADL15_42310 [Actinoplanes awajinensis subsp. mycoplanecinus]|uniref:UmuC domain-containing protein n=1 Tax=Actinoplanes awajinensis subsp. mycoplanecinus TaxID=135947 RepID=A0A117MM67_9ACTN|nr:hypothetical protein ADL15_42310 [Actinoplanes awajinensis subsp. mycoplanecinus]
MRTLLLWCPDWPVVAAEIVLGVPAAEPIAVFANNRVLACSEAARRETVRRGLRRRDAQGRCPQLVVVEHDPGRDARAFEPVVAAVEEVAAGVEVIRPGACALAARGPSRYYGGEETAAERIVEHVGQTCAVESQVGIADGVFAAGIAARAGRIVAPGGTPAFLADVPVGALDRPELNDLLRRLGVTTLGEFAALPAGDVLTRFGFDGALAHRLACGSDHRPLAVRQPPPDLAVSDTYDEPLDRVDTAAFAGRVLAERLHERLAGYGLACTRLGVEAVTADGQELHRVWRHDGLLTAAAIAERVRWQLDGWLTGARRSGPARPTAGLVKLSLIPDGILVHAGLQPGLWGDAGAEWDRAHRAFSRVQGLLGPEAVVTPVIGGGRSGDDQIRLVPWGDERSPAHPAAAHADPIPGLITVPVLDRTIAPELPASPATLSTRHFPVPITPSRPPLTAPASPAPPAAPVTPARPLLAAPAPAPPVSAVSRAAAVSAAPAPAVSRAVAVGRVDAVDSGPIASRAEAVSPAPAVAAGRKVAEKPGERLASVSHLRPIVRQDVPEPEREHRERPGPQDVVAGGPMAGRPEVTPAPGQPAVVRGRKARRPPLLPPWPGRLPRPSPAMVLPQPLPAVVHDETGLPIGVSARLELTGVPAALTVDHSGPLVITGWAGPWPIDERWWTPEEGRRRARFQMSLADGRALLLSLAAGQWTVEAIYD